jgi:hypothetical protein
LDTHPHRCSFCCTYIGQADYREGKKKNQEKKKLELTGDQKQKKEKKRDEETELPRIACIASHRIASCSASGERKRHPSSGEMNTPIAAQQSETDAILSLSEPQHQASLIRHVEESHFKGGKKKRRKSPYCPLSKKEADICGLNPRC